MRREFVKYNLPKTWVWTTIDELGIVVSGGTPSTKEPRFWRGEIPWITPADLSNYTDKYISKGRRTISELGLEYSSAKLLPPGSILFSSRAPIGYVVIAKDYLTTNQGFKNLIPLPSISNDYLFYYLQSIKSLAEGLASGTTFPELSGTNFKKIPVPLPPYKEQLRLVSKIEELLSDLNDAEKTLKQIQKQLEIYRHAVLKNAFNGALTKEWRHDNNIEKPVHRIKRILSKRIYTYKEELNKYKLALFAWQKNKKNKKPRKPSPPPKEISLNPEEYVSLSKLPNSWGWQKIGNIAFVTKLAGFEFSKHVVYKQKGTIPVIKAQNVSKEGFKDTSDSFVDKKTLAILPRIQLLGGEILFVFIGAGIGNVALVPEGKKYLLGPNVAMIKPDVEINNKFLLYFLLSSTGHKHVSSLVRSTAQGSISMENIRNIILPVTSHSEQKQIVEEIETRLTNLKKIDETIEQSFSKIKKSKYSIFKEIFQGKMSVTEVDTNNASKLLGKLKQEKFEFLQNLKLKHSKKPKKRTIMQKQPSVVEILRQAKMPLLTRDVWLDSELRDDIELFYAELKKIQKHIEVTFKGTNSYIKMKNENR